MAPSVPTSPAPPISVALPVYNAAGSVRESLESVLTQTYEDLELVVVDNASTDDTQEIVRGMGDPRIRLHVNPANIGPHRNMNRAVTLCRGALVKFLHADDVLAPRCIERLASLFDGHERIGLAFCRRRIELAARGVPDWEQFRSEFQDAHRRFGDLGEVNDGPALLRRWLAADPLDNWIGEPVAVMMRRSTLERIGLFNPHVRMLGDADVWARSMAVADVGFVDDELAAFRFHPGSVTLSQHAGRWWLDRLWLLESLAADADARAAVPEIERLLAVYRRRAVKRLMLTALREPSALSWRLGDMRRYAAYRAWHRLPDDRLPPPTLAA